MTVGAGAVSTVARGLAGYSGEIASLLGKSLNVVRMGFTHSFTGAARAIVSGASDEFFSSLAAGGWKGVAAAGLIAVPTAVMNLTNFFDDGRRIREIASGESNFYTDRSAAAKTWGLSALGLASSTVLGVSGAMMGAATTINPLGKALTIGSGILATGSLLSRNLYKYLTMDLPFKPNAGLGLLSMNRPISRVDDPSSPYYMLSHMMEKTVKNRQIQDQTKGELGSEYAKQLEDIGLSITNYLTA